MLPGNEDLLDGRLRTEEVDVEHQVVEVRVGYVAAEEPADEFPAAAIERGDELLCLGLVDRVLLHDPPYAVLLRGDDPHRQALVARQQELAAPAYQDHVAPAGRRHDNPSQVDHVLLVGDDLVIEPRPQDVVGPVRNRLVYHFQHRPREVETLGHAIQEILVEHLPAESLTQRLPDHTAAGARFARDRNVVPEPAVRRVETVRLDRPIGHFLGERPRPHLTFRRGQDPRFFPGLLFHRGSPPVRGCRDDRGMPS